MKAAGAGVPVVELTCLTHSNHRGVVELTCLTHSNHRPMLSVFPVFQTHNLIYFKLEQQTMQLRPSALAILLPPFVPSSARGGVSAGEDAGGAVVGRAGRPRLVGDYPKT